jgi:putative PIN family toxin of toxin-antitoxin system
MTKAVFDTVVFVRALIRPRSRWGLPLSEFRNRYVLVLSPDIMTEILSVVRRPVLQQRLRRFSRLPPVERVLQLFAQAEVVEPARVPPVCRDLSDDKFFACALTGNAHYIVSEDKDVLAVREYRGIRCVTAEEFFQVLAGGAKA